MQPKHSYKHCSAPVVEFCIVRFFLARCQAFQMNIRHLDVKTAFLNGEINEEIFKRLPRLLPAPYGGSYRKLLRAMYGLKQAYFQWHEKLTSDLQRIAFGEFRSAKCVFFRIYRGALVLLLIYVDEILVSSTSHTAIETTLKYLQDLYTVRDLGRPELFLGPNLYWMKNEKGETVLHLSQKQSIRQYLDDLEIAPGKPVRSPMISNFHSTLAAEGERDPVEIKQYQEIVGTLLYVMVKTRSDILAPVTILARHFQTPTPFCWKALDKVLRYLHIKSSTANVI